MGVAGYVQCKKCGGINEIKAGESKKQIRCKLCRNILQIKVGVEYNAVNQLIFDGNKYLKRCEFNNSFNSFRDVT